jgi:tetratricopeptide (TPR) repeat protein
MYPERIEISGLTPGLPVWIRVSYHPAWRSTTGERIYRATPAFILVFPRGERLTLRFGYAWPHWLGLGLSVLGLGLLVVLGLRPELGRRGPLAPGRGQAPGRRRGLLMAAAGLALLALLAAGHGDATTLRRRARELIAAGQVEQGRELLRRLISRYHLHRELDYSYYDLALTYYREGDYRRAAGLLQELLQRFPESRLAPEALFHLGMSLHRLGRQAEARAIKRRLLQRYPRNPWAAQARELL